MALWGKKLIFVNWSFLWYYGIVCFVRILLRCFVEVRYITSILIVLAFLWIFKHKLWMIQLVAGHLQNVKSVISILNWNSFYVYVNLCISMKYKTEMEQWKDWATKLCVQCWWHGICYKFPINDMPYFILWNNDVQETRKYNFLSLMHIANIIINLCANENMLSAIMNVSPFAMSSKTSQLII